MNNISNTTVGQKADESIVAYANFAVIPAGGKIGEFHVMSRMFLWCRGGTGKVTANCRTYEFPVGSYLLLPWGHRIRYHNDSKEPWSLGGIHIIPKLPRGTAVDYRVKHNPCDIIKGGDSRRDVDLGKDLEGVIMRNFDFSSGLYHLAEHIVQWFKRGKIKEDAARMYSRIMIDALQEEIYDPSPIHERVPVSLKKISDSIEACLEKKIRMADLEKAGSCSAATVCRLFRKYLGTTPVRWINTRRIEKASELLQATDLRIGEIAERVGIGDLFYFSKTFRNIKGVSARKYREERSNPL